MPSSSGERVYLNNDLVRVTASRLIVYDITTKVYAMRGITSVQIVRIPPNQVVTWWLLFWGTVTFCFLVGLVLLIVAIIRLQTRRPALLIRTAGGEDALLIGTHPDEIEDIVRAVNRAIKDLA